MLYNLYIAYKNGNYNLFGVSEQQLQKIIEAYLQGAKEVTIKGNRHIIDGLRSLRIFQHDSESTPEEASAYYLQNINFRAKGFPHYYLPPETLLKMGKEVTEVFIQDREYGELKIKQEMKSTTENSAAQTQKNSQSGMKEYFSINKSSYTISTGIFWVVLPIICSVSFFLGTIKYDVDKISLAEENKALRDTLKVHENTIKYVRHNSDSALNIIAHMPYDEMRLDTLSFRKVQTTIENAGAVLSLNK